MARPLLNILWIILGGGIILFFEYIIGGIFLCLTIIGIPFGVQKFKLAFFALAPFGSKVVESNNPGGCLIVVFNILWIFTFGISIAVTHLILAFLYAITIIGIPFASQHIKMAGLAIAPFGKTIV
jgi:uncharacterized membrane protein YccF (DUF307 family)